MMYNRKLIILLSVFFFITFLATVKTQDGNTIGERRMKSLCEKAIELVSNKKEKRQKTYADYGWGGGRFGKKRSEGEMKKRQNHDFLQVGGRFGRDIKDN